MLLRHQLQQLLLPINNDVGKAQQAVRPFPRPILEKRYGRIMDREPADDSLDAMVISS
jgi:hypothetical protein